MLYLLETEYVADFGMGLCHFEFYTLFFKILVESLYHALPRSNRSWPKCQVKDHDLRSDSHFNDLVPDPVVHSGYIEIHKSCFDPESNTPGSRSLSGCLLMSVYLLVPGILPRNATWGLETFLIIRVSDKRARK